MTARTRDRTVAMQSRPTRRTPPRPPAGAARRHVTTRKGAAHAGLFAGPGPDRVRGGRRPGALDRAGRDDPRLRAPERGRRDGPAVQGAARRRLPEPALGLRHQRPSAHRRDRRLGGDAGRRSGVLPARGPQRGRGGGRAPHRVLARPRADEDDGARRADDAGRGRRLSRARSPSALRRGGPVRARRLPRLHPARALRAGAHGVGHRGRRAVHRAVGALGRPRRAGGPARRPRREPAAAARRLARAGGDRGRAGADLRRPRGDPRADGAARRRGRAGAARRVRARAGHGRSRRRRGGQRAHRGRPLSGLHPRSRPRRPARGRRGHARYRASPPGPAPGALPGAAGGPRIALLVTAASFLAVARAAQALRARREPHRGERSSERARDGVAFLLHDGVLAPVIVAAFVSLMFMTASATAEVFFAKDVLHAGDTGYGVLMTLWTLGMVVGSTLVASRVPATAYATAALGAMALQGAGLALPTLWLVLPFALAAYLAGGIGHGTKNVVVRTLIHTRVPDELRGRAWAAYSAGRNAAELVALVGGGLLVAAIGARWTLLAAGALPILAASVALAQATRRRALPPASLTSAASPSTTTRSRPAHLASYRAASAARKSAS